MINLITRGGLGNQMFQYALALQIQKVNGGTIRINGSLHPHSIDKRKQSLYHFALGKDVKICSKAGGYFLIARFLLGVLRVTGVKMLIDLLRRNRQGAARNEGKLLAAGLYYTSDPFFMPEVRKRRGSSHIYAYCQSPAVLEGIEDELREQFSIKDEPGAANREMLSEISACNAVCVHIRRGDYLLYPQYMVCDEEYYKKAIAQASAELENPVFYIFSNCHEDIEWIKANYHFNANIRYVDLDNPDYEELRLMTACKHFIICNSTFSWWAAALGNAAGANKRVWAPALWFKGAENVDIALKDWTLL